MVQGRIRELTMACQNCRINIDLALLAGPTVPGRKDVMVSVCKVHLVLGNVTDLKIELVVDLLGFPMRDRLLEPLDFRRGIVILDTLAQFDVGRADQCVTIRNTHRILDDPIAACHVARFVAHGRRCEVYTSGGGSECVQRAVVCGAVGQHTAVAIVRDIGARAQESAVGVGGRRSMYTQNGEGQDADERKCFIESHRGWYLAGEWSVDNDLRDQLT